MGYYRLAILGFVSFLSSLSLSGQKLLFSTQEFTYTLQNDKTRNGYILYFLMGDNIVQNGNNDYSFTFSGEQAGSIKLTIEGVHFGNVNASDLYKPRRARNSSYDDYKLVVQAPPFRRCEDIGIPSWADIWEVIMRKNERLGAAESRPYEPTTPLAGRSFEIVVQQNGAHTIRLKYNIVGKELGRQQFGSVNKVLDIDLRVDGLNPAPPPQNLDSLCFVSARRSSIEAVIECYNNQRNPRISPNSCYPLTDYGPIIYDYIKTEHRRIRAEAVNSGDATGYKNTFEDTDWYEPISREIDVTPPSRPADEIAWRKVRTSKTVAPLLEFIRQFPNSEYVIDARYLIRELSPADYTIHKQGDRRFEVRIQNMQKPRYKDISMQEGLVIDGEGLWTDSLLVVSYDKEGEFEVLIEDDWGKRLSIPFSNALSVSWDYLLSDSTQLVFNFSGGVPPFRLLFSSATDGHIDFSYAGIASPQFILPLDSLYQRGLAGEYEIEVRHGAPVKTQLVSGLLYLPELKTQSWQDYIWIVPLVLAILLMLIAMYYYRKQQRNTHQ